MRVTHVQDPVARTVRVRAADVEAVALLDPLDHADVVPTFVLLRFGDESGCKKTEEKF